MGYAQDATWDVRLPVDQHAALFEFATELAEWHDDIPSGLWAVEYLFGESDSALRVAGDHILGTTWGKDSDSDSVITWLAEHGASGTIDFLGEDNAMSRVRFRAGAQSAEWHAGQIVYPTDQEA